MAVESVLLARTAELALVLLSLAILFAFIRLLIGPDAADRIVAMDLISVLIVSCLGVFAIYTGERAFLDVAIAYALIAFLGTVALARFRERMAGGGPGETEKEEDSS
ncbi:MAG: monovalent cation/H+ antiporter complex subunit F [Desulfosalsimonadaceae bacterium]